MIQIAAALYAFSYARPIAQIDDIVCLTDCALAVGDRQDGDFTCDPPNMVHDSCFRRLIEGGTRFVQEQKLRFAVKRPGNCNSLTFATGQFQATLSDDR